MRSIKTYRRRYLGGAVAPQTAQSAQLQQLLQICIFVPGSSLNWTAISSEAKAIGVRSFIHTFDQETSNRSTIAWRLTEVLQGTIAELNDAHYEHRF